MPNTRIRRTASAAARAAASATDTELELVIPVPEDDEAPGSTLSLAPTAKMIIKEKNTKIKALEDERDFLREQLKKALDKPSTGTQAKKQRMDDSTSDDSSETDSNSSSSSSSERRKKKKRKKKLKKAQGGHFGKRMKTPDDVVHRYKAVLKTFQKTHSINKSCEKHDVDRNTIAFTAVIAEVTMAADNAERTRIPAFNTGTLMAYANNLKSFLDEEPALRTRIDEKKANKEFLPITYKFKK